MKKVRESNFELLRCMLMLMVVLVHYNNSAMGKAFSYVTEGSINYYFTYFMESLAIIGTNGFVLLTGYFSWKKESASLRKPVGLLMYVVAYNLLFFVLRLLIIKEPFSLIAFIFSFVPANWYIVLFVVLLLLSPYLNEVIRHMSKQGYMTLLVLMFLLFSVWPTILDVAKELLGMSTVGMNTVAINGADNGYSIVNFVMLYMIGAFLSKYDVLKYNLKWDIIGYIIFSILIFLQEVLLCAGWSYANPFVICSTVCFFNIFRNMHFTSKLVNTISSASLGVFLIHTQYLISTYAWEKCNIKAACEGDALGLAVHMLMCCVLTYLLCTVLDIVGRKITNPVSKVLDKIPILTNCFIGPKVD